MMWKEYVVTYFKAFSENLPEGTEEDGEQTWVQPSLD